MRGAEGELAWKILRIAGPARRLHLQCELDEDSKPLFIVEVWSEGADAWVVAAEGDDPVAAVLVADLRVQALRGADPQVLETRPSD